MEAPNHNHHHDESGHGIVGTAVQAAAFDAMSQSPDMVRRDSIYSVLTKRQSNVTACKQLVVSIVFFALYAYSMQQHYDVSETYLLESKIRRDLEQSMEHTATVADVYKWLRNDMLDIFFVQRDENGVELPVKEWSRIFAYSQLQGELSLSQSRVGAVPWGKKLSGPLDNFTADLQARDVGFGRNASAASAGRRLDILREEMRSIVPYGLDESGDYVVNLPTTTPLSELKATLQYLEDREWLDNGTGAVMVNAIVLNAELSLPRLERLAIVMSFGRGGGVWYRVSLLPIFLRPHRNLATLAIDVVWILMLLVNSLFLLKNLWKSAMGGTLMSFVGTGSTLVEAAVVVGGWGVVGTFYVAYFTQLPLVVQRLSDLRIAVASGLPGEEPSEKLSESISEVLPWLKNFETFSVWYTLALMVRFFIGFSAQARLAVVVKTLKATSVDLFHFLVLFVPTFIAYVISGNIIFGRRLEEFATIGASLGTCFRILIENEYEWELLAEEHFITTAIWVWSFLLIVTLLLLNMVLAIILDIYNDVRHDVDNADSILLFFQHWLLRAWSGKAWVHNTEIKNMMDNMSGSNIVPVDDLRALFPTMREDQLEELTAASRANAKFMLKSFMPARNFLKSISSTSVKLHELRQAIQDNRDSDDLVSGAGFHEVERNASVMSNLSVGTAGSSMSSLGSAVSPQLDKQVEEEKKSSALRAAGLIRPYPGAPKAPGGLPPLLPADKASNERSQSDSKPPWLQEIDRLMDGQEHALIAAQAQIQEIQWRLLATSRELIKDTRGLASSRSVQSKANFHMD